MHGPLNTEYHTIVERKKKKRGGEGIQDQEHHLFSTGKLTYQLKS